MEITVASLSRRFGNRQALRDITVTFPSGALTSILGPSGCGKSTMLNIIAGILEPTTGTVSYGGSDVTALPPEKRNLGFVFQNYALYPHLTVEQNIGYPLRFGTKLSKAQKADRIAELADLVRVSDLLDHRPGELSGGQQQRVAIARALAKSPSVVLMDEPLSNLDARLRSEMRTEIRRIQSESGVTMILVTHDQEDALAISDQVVVMQAGHIEQVSPPIETYADPHTLFVVDFIGEPPASQLLVTVDPTGTISLLDRTRLDLPPLTAPGHHEDLVLAVRADAASLSADPAAPRAEVVNAVTSRQGYLYDLRIGADATIRVRASLDAVHDIGDTVGYTLDPAAVFLFDRESGERRR